jgi:hypothetical protein
MIFAISFLVFRTSGYESPILATAAHRTDFSTLQLPLDEEAW